MTEQIVLHAEREKIHCGLHRLTTNCCGQLLQTFTEVKMGTLSNPRRQRGHGKTKDLIGRTIA